MTAASAQSRASEIIRAALERCAASGTVQLPGLHALAAQAGVSHQTVRKAVATLFRGRLTIIDRKGIFITTGAPQPLAATDTDTAAIEPSDNAAGQPVESLAARIRHDFESGALDRARPVAGSKELERRYGCGYRTIRRALETLAVDQYLQRYGRRYRVRTHIPDISYGTIGFVAVTDAMNSLMHFTPRASDFWRAFDARCARDRTRIQVCGMLKSLGQYPWHDGRIETLARRDRDGQTLGYILWTISLTPEYAAKLLGILAQTGKPVVIMHDNALIPPGDILELIRPHRRMRLYHFSISPLCGTVMGRYLAQLGHRHLALFYNLKHDPLWDGRESGLRQALERTGEPWSITRFAAGDTAEEYALRAARWPLAPLVARFNRRVHTDYASVLRSYDETMSAVSASDLNRDLFNKYVMAQAFRKALRDERITAWLGLGDPAAVLALSFLRKKKIAVPAELSVAGFDNSIEAIGSGLTTYDFNMTGLVDAMLDYLLSPSADRRAATPESIEIPGQVMHRFSTGPANNL